MIRRFRTAIIAAILTVSGLVPALLLASPVDAALTCAGTWNVSGAGTTYALLYEGPNFLTADPRGQVLCIKAGATSGISISDLKLVNYSNPNDTSVVCDGQLATSYGTWNDCTSGIKFFSDCHHSLSLYEDANYGSLAYSFTSSVNLATLPFGVDNAISSLKLTYHSACVAAPPA